jgi:hypothetical protein
MRNYVRFGTIPSSRTTSSFSPTDIAGLQLWLDPEETGGRHYITANGDAKIQVGRHSITANGDAKITTAVTDPFGNATGVADFDGSRFSNRCRVGFKLF